MERHTYGALTWIHLDAATPGDLTAMQDEFGLTRLALQVARSPHPRPRLTMDQGSMVLVVKPATYHEPAEAIEIGQLAIITGDRVIATIGAGYDDRLLAIRNRLAGDAERLEIGPATVLYAIVDELVDGYRAVLDELDNDVDEIESQVFSSARGSHSERIYRLKSQMQELRRAAEALPNKLDELLASQDLPTGIVPLSHHLTDVRERAARVVEHVGHLDELLNSVLSAHVAQIGIQQNNDMRRISAWVAIVAAPTAMASIYGMNFRHMPELEWQYGYVVALTVMGTACILLYRLFKRSGWL